MIGTDREVTDLLCANAVRTRCGRLWQAGLEDKLTHVVIDASAWDTVLGEVAGQIRRTHPSGPIPIHGRLNHLRAPGWDLATPLVQGAGTALIDAVTISVLLDAGAGPTWTFTDPVAGALGRSEGLAVAAHRAVASGVFATDGRAFGVDATALAGLDTDRLAVALQSRPGNELVGLDGRADLLRQLGTILIDEGSSSLGDLLSRDLLDDDGTAISAADLLRWILTTLGPLWPGRIERDGRSLGDTWTHPLAGGTGPTAGLVPFHKLSQWLTYSLIEPLHHLGVAVTGTAELTGLAEYRNGGMLVHLGLVGIRGGVPTEPIPPDDPLVVEWRAVTVSALDIIHSRLPRFLPEREPLSIGEMLEAGTWPLGRRLAQQDNPDAIPPIRIRSDGTVF